MYINININANFENITLIPAYLFVYKQKHKEKQ